MTEFYCIITDLGLSKLATIKAASESISLEEMVVGDGNGAYYEPQPSQTKLVNEKHRFNIGRVYIDNKNAKQLMIEASVADNVGGFFVREVGILDSDGELFAIGKYPVTYKPVTEDGAGKELFIRMGLLFSNNSNISLVINSNSAIASVEAVEDMLSEIKHNNLKEIQGGNSIGIYHLELSQHETIASINELKTKNNAYKILAVNDNGDAFNAIALDDEISQNSSEFADNIILIKQNNSIYKKTISTDVSFSFDVSALENLEENKDITIELILDMETLSSVTFPENVKWLDDETPDMSDKVTYLIAFRSFDKGKSWVGNGQGWVPR